MPKGKGKKKSHEQKQDAAIKQLKRVAQVDLRYNQIVTGNTRLTTTAGSAILLNGMVTGTIDGTRSGSSIGISDIKCNVELWNDANTGATTGPAGAVVRVMLVYDKECNTAIFANADLLDNNSTNANNYLSQLSFINRKRFRVLYDKMVDVKPLANTRAAAAGTQYEFETKLLKIHKKLKKPLAVQYIAGAGAGTVADIELGSVYLVLFPEQNNMCQYSQRSMIQYAP